jgi:hypothetical protein
VFSVLAGKTVIERNSHDSSVISPDPESYWTMYKKMKEAYEGKSQYYIDRVSTLHATDEIPRKNYLSYTEYVCCMKSPEGSICHLLTANLISCVSFQQ